MPTEDLYLEFGHTNRNLNKYLINSVSKEYKVAPSCLITRLFEAGIVTEMYYKNYFRFLNSGRGKVNEGTLLDCEINSELPKEFDQRVYRALSDQLITTSRAAELLSIPLFVVMKNMIQNNVSLNGGIEINDNSKTKSKENKSKYSFKGESINEAINEDEEEGS